LDIVAPAPLVKFCLRNLFLEPILYRTTLGVVLIVQNMEPNKL
jgi:hypothetical protein